MAKTYKPQEEEKATILCEPAAAHYGQASTHQRLYQVTEVEKNSIMRAKEQFARGEFYTEEEMNKRIAEWLSER